MPAGTAMGRLRSRALAQQRAQSVVDAARRASQALVAPSLGDFERSFSLTKNPTQSAFVYCLDKFSMYCGGIGAGKTFAGALRAVIASLSLPGSMGVIGAPTYGMLEDATQREFFNLLPPAAVADFNRQKQHLWLVNGSEILFRSMDNPDRLRGIQLAWFWFDEAPYCGYYAWTVAKGRLRQPGFDGWGWATGTPHGKDGYYQDFEGKRKKGHRLFRASTYANQANLPEGYVEGLSYSGEFYDQEILGLFTAFEGLVYRTFQADPQAPDSHILRAPRAKREHFARVIGGIDWGFKHPTAILPFGVDGDERAWQLDEHYQARQKIADVVAAAVAMTRKYRVECWWCGPDEPEHIETLREAMAREGLSCQVRPADNSVQPGIQTVAGMLDKRGDGTRGLYVDPRCKQTISEYGQYAYREKTKALRLDDEKPAKEYDDAMDGTRYALHSEFGQRNRSAQAARAHVSARARLRAQKAEAAIPTSGRITGDDWY